MKRSFWIFLFVVGVFSFGCESRLPKGGIANGPRLKRDLTLIDSLQLDDFLTSEIREFNDSGWTAFAKDVENLPVTDHLKKVARDRLHGITFHATQEETRLMQKHLFEGLQKRGYTLFVYDDRFGRSSNVIGVLKTTDMYAVLDKVQTDGINYGIDNDSLLKVIRRFDDKYRLQIVGAGQDWCEFNITHRPTVWMDMAREVYKVCPDVVDQGTETVEKLALEMERTGRLYFWWD